MIKIDGVELRTEAQWGQKYRAVLKRQIGNPALFSSFHKLNVML